MIYPKCAQGKDQFITATGHVRPCCWLSDRPERNEYQQFECDKFNIAKTPYDEIVNVHLKEWIDNLKTNPDTAGPTCRTHCSAISSSLKNPLTKVIEDV